MPRETIGINLSTLPVYEAGAVFLACIAHPDDESDRQKFYMALCRQTIIQSAAQDLDWAWRQQPIRPGFFIVGEQLSARALTRGFSLLNDRIVAAHRYLLPFLKQQSGRVLTVGGFTVTVNNMASLALGDLNSKDTGIANVKSRVFKPSRPVLHAAGALSVLTQAYSAAFPGQDRAPAGLLLHHRQLLAKTVEWAEDCRLQLSRLKNPRIREDQTIQFILQ